MGCGISDGRRAPAVPLAAAVGAVLLAVAPASAHHPQPTGFAASAGDVPETRAAPAACPTTTDGGDPIQPDLALTGSFSTAEQGSYVMVPFPVPADQDAVRVKYCFDQPENPVPLPLPNLPKHTLDLGLYQARSGVADLWDGDEFRGWGGSSHPDVTVSPNGFSSEAEYLEAPRRHRRGHTTRGFVPGPIPAGEWALELGVAAVASQSEGDATGQVGWRVEIDWIDSEDYSNDPYAPAPYDQAPADPEAGWYTGDFHVHAEHSSLNDATMTEAIDYAFEPRSSGGAGLDFITLSDYVTNTAWGEIGRYQDAHPGKLISRSAEVITYRGHVNNHGSATWVDYRTGPIRERAGDGTLTTLRPARPASEVFDAIHAAGGYTQINHPETFPSEIPTFGNFCRGCSWEYSDAETDYEKVDAIEIATGPAGLSLPPLDPGPNPFTPLALLFYEHALDTGAKVAAVGSSDSHNAGRTGGGTGALTQSPIGQASTVVLADELSEEGIEEGVEAGHTYVKLWGSDGPDLRLCAGDLGGDGACSLDPDPAEAIMGDTVPGSSTTFSARVLGAGLTGASRPGLYLLMVFKDGLPLIQLPIVQNDFSFGFPSLGPGRYRLQVMRLLTGVAAIEAVSSPIYLGGTAEPPDTDADDDGLDDDADNCALASNPGQEDLDGDGLGDACDADRDGDNVADADDTCPDIPGIAADGCPPAPTETKRPAQGTSCDIPIQGTRGRDRLAGTAASELLAGRRGRDRLRGRGGDDCVFGGGGGDRLKGGPGADLLSGGTGPDVISARDGEPDRIRCGKGADRAVTDPLDEVRRCEQVRRR